MDLQIWRLRESPKSLAYNSRKRLRSLILFLILFVLLAGISALFDAYEVQQNSRK